MQRRSPASLWLVVGSSLGKSTWTAFIVTRQSSPGSSPWSGFSVPSWCLVKAPVRTRWQRKQHWKVTRCHKLLGLMIETQPLIFDGAFNACLQLFFPHRTLLQDHPGQEPKALLHFCAKNKSKSHSFKEVKLTNKDLRQTKLHRVSKSKCSRKQRNNGTSHLIPPSYKCVLRKSSKQQQNHSKVDVKIW